MMSKEDNLKICRVAPGTPMGAVFRRYWNPICTSAQLPTPDCAPLKQTLLGQDFVVFRNSEGVVGVLDELCMHRGASLALGRVEDCGIRCIYHGWKFDVEGRVVDIMNNPEGKRQSSRLRANAYPVVEAGGIVWTYLGPKERQPVFPRYAFMDLPAENCVTVRLDIHANWVQATEGGLDSSHVGILHTNAARPSWNGKSEEVVGAMNDTGPVLEVEETDFGYHYGAFRKNANGGPDNIRVVPFFMPSGRIIPDFQGTTNATIVFEIPLDDEHTATYSVRYGDKPITRESRLHEQGFDDPEWYDEASCKFLFDRTTFHRQNRDAMDVTWTGFKGIALEDAVIATSMGPIYDRSQEHLIASDMAVATFRRLLLESIDRVERGEDPIGLHVEHCKITAVDAPLPSQGHWRQLLPGHKVKEPA